jgi:3-phosphoshikimate 1-carboxyvinyltransferase
MRSAELIYPARQFRGCPHIPGDKSISHRSLILGALAKGKTEITGLLQSEDVSSTQECLKKLGTFIHTHNGTTTVEGGILGRLAASQRKNSGSHPFFLDCGNSGTTIRLLLGSLAGFGLQAILSGDSSLNRRPMRRVADPLRKMGALIHLAQDNFPPIQLTGNQLQGIQYHLEIASAQLKSAILLAALSAEGPTSLTGKIHSRDHTEKMLPLFGGQIEVRPDSIQILGNQRLYGAQIQIPGDPSTASFWMAAASLIPGSSLVLNNISLNPTRLGFLNVLRKMGAVIQTEITHAAGEISGRIEVSGETLKGVTLSESEIPSLIDEIPLIAVLASQAQGTTEVSGAEELRVKESDRLDAIAFNLKAMGVKLELKSDGFRIEGPQKLSGAVIESFHDHRIAMAFSIAGLVAEGPTQILDSSCVNISYPGFFSTLRELTE